MAAISQHLEKLGPKCPWNTPKVAGASLFPSKVLETFYVCVGIHTNLCVCMCIGMCVAHLHKCFCVSIHIYKFMCVVYTSVYMCDLYIHINICIHVSIERCRENSAS